ncbi:MAG: hypothetical protein JW849_11915 [Phycisphaerae bacterium]|nr:hypothetical protein [Phycisphaerae bacterium]
MSGLRISKGTLTAVAAGVVILLGAEASQAGGFSIRIGGLSIGSGSRSCTTRSYVYISDYDDDWDCRSYRPCQSSYYYYSSPRPRVYYNVKPYRGGRRFAPMHRPGGHSRRGHSHHRR